MMRLGRWLPFCLVVVLAIASGNGWASSPRAVALRLKPTVGPPTTSTEVAGRGFGATEVIDITFDGALLAQATTDPLGEFHTTIAIPGSARPGRHHVRARGETSGLSGQTQFLVVT